MGSLGIEALILRRQVCCLQVDEGEKQGKAVILMNPVLKDIPSSAGIMGVRSFLFLQLHLASTSSASTSFTSTHHSSRPFGLSPLQIPLTSCQLSF